MFLRTLAVALLGMCSLLASQTAAQVGQPAPDFTLDGSAGSQATMQQRAHDAYEQHKQAAIRINDLAGRIYSEADANAVVAEIGSVFVRELPTVWASSGIRQRVAHAEYEAVRNPAKLISEQRIVGIWNLYVREIGAPEEALVTTAEIHNMRDAERTVAVLMWNRGTQTIWTMPNIYTVEDDGNVAENCRAIEAIRVIYDLYRFRNLRSARDRVRRGVLVSAQIRNRDANSTPQTKGSVLLAVQAEENPVRTAESRYLKEHGSLAYDQLLKRLFDELFPAE